MLHPSPALSDKQHTMVQSASNAGDFREENAPDRSMLECDIVSEWREGKHKVIEIQKGPGEDVRGPSSTFFALFANARWGAGGCHRREERVRRAADAQPAQCGVCRALQAGGPAC